MLFINFNINYNQIDQVMMRQGSRLETSAAELCKLKNQIRVELNKVRPTKEIPTFDKPSRPVKKVFSSKYKPTNIIDPPSQRGQAKTPAARRHFENNSLVHIDNNKSRERKHYQKHNADRVEIQLPIHRKKSAYLNVKTEAEVSPLKVQCANSLYGVGMKDKSLNASKSGKKIYHQRLAHKYDLI